MHDDVPLAYQVCVLCLAEPTVCLVSTLAHCILGIFIVREATVMFVAVDACLFYLMQVPYSTHYPPMMYYPPTTFFGQKLCGRVFIYIVSAHPLPWDCSLYRERQQHRVYQNYILSAHPPLSTST